MSEPLFFWAGRSTRGRSEPTSRVIDNLKPEETRAFIDTAFRDSEIKTTATAKALLSATHFAASGGNGEKKWRRAQRFFGLSSERDPEQ